MNDEVKQGKEIEATEAAQANAQQNGPVTEENTPTVPADAAPQGQAAESAVAGDLNPEFEALVQALEAGEDIGEQLEATAAGEGGGGAGDSISSGVRLDRIDSQANPNAGIDPDIPFPPVIVPTADTEIIVDAGSPAPEDDFIEVIPDDGVIVESGGSFGGSVIENDNFGPDGQGTPPVVAVNGSAVNVGQPIAGSLGGTLIINADGTYDYTPPPQVDHSDDIADTETFTYTIQDSTGDTATATVVFTIVDTVPVIDILPAVADATPTTDSIDETNTLDGAWTSADGADTPSSIVVIYNGTEYSLDDAIDTGVGTLTVKADGTWTFEAGEVDATENISFSLRITDSDGSVDTDTHTLEIVDVNKPPVARPGSLTVSEEGLETGIPDTDPDAILDTTNSATDSTTIPGTDPDGDVLSYTLSTSETGLESGGVPITFSGAGTIGDPLIGTIPDGDGTTPIITLTVDSDGKVDVTLSGPLDHDDTTQEDNLSFDVTLTVSDGDLSDTSTVVVTVEDDSPTVDVVLVTTEGEDQEGPVLVVEPLLTTQDAETIGLASDTAVSAANFGGVFAIGSSSAGADGLGTAA
ncbi:MAG: hypothetical protein KBT63_12000, partial [Porticoccaceae bacterium]|nr:hypothetical protein [Porticoccaceae bacterium]